MIDGLVVRLAGKADLLEVGLLVDAMDLHYRGEAARRAPDLAIDMLARMFDQREGTRILLAEFDGNPLGMACFAVIRPGHALSGLIFLKDLFVLSSLRGRGIGTALMSGLAGYAVEHQIGRIDLETSLDNVAAQRLYQRLAGVRTEKLQYRWDGSSLRTLASTTTAKRSSQ